MPHHYTKPLTLLLTLLLTLTILPHSQQTTAAPTPSLTDDLDPLVDLNLTIDILSIRGLDPTYQQHTPSFQLKLWINNESFESPIWNQTHLYNPWTITTDIPDTQDNVTIHLQLWDQSQPALCDLTGTTDRTANLTYHVTTGHWTGDDHLQDPSGYGRLNGYDDGHIYNGTNDAELTFTIYTNDYDHDGIPYWTETHLYGTDPTIDNRGQDPNHDGLPIEWDFHWGYDPFTGNYSALDPDNDSLTNHEEYLTSSFNPDPFRRDLFLELDFMATSPDGTSSIIPAASLEQLKDPFARRNIVFHFDTGELNGGETIPFDDMVNTTEVKALYYTYFLHNDTTTWRRGVFHYGLYVYSTKPNGYGFCADGDTFMGYGPGTNAFIISSKQMEKNARPHVHTLAYYYASATMHEMGHTMGIRHGNPPGCDMQLSKWPWEPGFWYYRNYKSIMNYHYTYYLFDYSDGSHGKRDFDDWSALSFSHFELPQT